MANRQLSTVGWEVQKRRDIRANNNRFSKRKGIENAKRFTRKATKLSTRCTVGEIGRHSGIRDGKHT